MKYYKDGYVFVAPSATEGKKYDVYKDDKKLASFGALGYQHYFDKIGAYEHLDHHDKKRRAMYRHRHAKDIDNYPHAGYFAAHYLW
jgi:hypothetical protein